MHSVHLKVYTMSLLVFVHFQNTCGQKYVYNGRLFRHCCVLLVVMYVNVASGVDFSFSGARSTSACEVRFNQRYAIAMTMTGCADQIFECVHPYITYNQAQVLHIELALKSNLHASGFLQECS